MSYKNLKLRNKNILLISPEPWYHIFVSKHHYATHLAARGNQVFFLNPPTNQTSVENTDFDNVYSVHYTGFIKGLRFFHAFLQRYFLKRKFEQLQCLCKVNFDIVWSFDNSVFYDFSALPNEVYCISHIVDLNQDFEFAKAARSADLCIGVIQRIVNKQQKFNLKSYLIGHGVNISIDKLQEVNLPGDNKIKALYTGNLQMPFIDWEILLELAQKNPQIDFIFLGSDSHKNDNAVKISVFELTNVYYLKEVNSKLLFPYLTSVDLLFLAYTYQYYNEYATPHKMMEYLLSGKMIISSWSKEYFFAHSKKCILMSKNRSEFINNFNIVANDLNYWNSSEKSSYRRNYALANTYDLQISKIELFINQCKL